MHYIYAAAVITSTASAPIVRILTAMITQELMNTITPIVLYLQFIVADEILPNLLHMLTSDTAQALECL